MKNYILFAVISLLTGRLTGQQKPSWKVDKYGKPQFNLFAQARSGGRKVVLSDLFALRYGELMD